MGSIGQSLSMLESHEHQHGVGVNELIIHQDPEDCQPGLSEGSNHGNGNEGQTDYDDMPALISDSTRSDD